MLPETYKKYSCTTCTRTFKCPSKHSCLTFRNYLIIFLALGKLYMKILVKINGSNFTEKNFGFVLFFDEKSAHSFRTPFVYVLLSRKVFIIIIFVVIFTYTSNHAIAVIVFRNFFSCIPIMY